MWRMERRQLSLSIRFEFSMSFLRVNKFLLYLSLERLKVSLLMSSAVGCDRRKAEKIIKLHSATHITSTSLWFIFKLQLKIKSFHSSSRINPSELLWSCERFGTSLTFLSQATMSACCAYFLSHACMAAIIYACLRLGATICLRSLSLRKCAICVRRNNKQSIMIDCFSCNNTI